MKDKTDSAQRPGANMHEAPDRTRLNRWTVGIFCFIAIVLGAYQAWDTRHAMNADGISYLDMGDAYLRGDWDMAINSYWSPFYSWLLGVTLLIFKPSAEWEFSVVHLVNFLIYVCTLACFHFSLMQLISYNKYRLDESSECVYDNMPKWSFIAIGYSLFIWTSLNFITVSVVSPDMCIAAFVFLASGMLLRIRRGCLSWYAFITLGLVLGFSYLAKAIMFPVSLLFLFVGLFMVGSIRKAVTRTFVALLVFFLVAGPFIIVLSKSKGRLTYGDSGKLNYAWYVNGATQWVHWQGAPPGNGTPEHPTRKVFDEPGVYEFGTPRGGTYPPWYDPSYWNEGMEVHFNLSKQLLVIKNIFKEYAVIFFKLQPGLIIGCIILYYLSRRRWLCIRDLAEHWNLLVPPVAVMCIYSLVHMERRFIGAFIVLLWMGVYSGIHVPASQKSNKLISSIPAFIAVVMMIALVYAPLKNAYGMMMTSRITHVRNLSWEAAAALKQMGIREGDKVASIGWSGTHYWARLARVRIVADIRHEEKHKFLEADRAVKSQVIKAFSDTGARLIVINEPEGLQDHDSMNEWERIGDTPFYAYFLPEK